MKKNATSKANKANKVSEKKAPERVTLKWRPVVDILASAEENERYVKFDRVEKQGGLSVVTLTIYESDSSVDPCVIDVMGISIRGLICDSKKGMFLSLPSRKGKDGEYYNDVTIYDKNFHSMMKDLLAAYYGGNADE